MPQPAFLNFATFLDRFNAITSASVTSWEAIGFLTPDDTIYAFGTDSKVISTVFESIAAPIIQTIANEFDYEIESSPQTVYPDFTLNSRAAIRLAITPSRIAIDVKTTYRGVRATSTIAPIKYTLGSYTSFLRSPTATKNIRHPYAQYTDHWVIGFLYTRREGVPAKVYHRPELSSIVCPYHDVQFFVQEKYKIVGLSPGSGNTKNIGSFATTNIEDLRQGRGPFAAHGKEVCDNYWRHYGEIVEGCRAYANIPEFLAWWQRRQGSA